MKSITSPIIAVIAVLVLSACSPSQTGGQLAIKGMRLGMGPPQLEQALLANGWRVTDIKTIAPGRSGGNLMNGERYYGRLVTDDQIGLIHFELNTHAFGAEDLSYQAFVESLQANYPIGELQQTHSWSDCGRWEGRGPAGEIIATSNCGAWEISVTIGAEQSGASFN